jgi:hypothetical protein
MRLVMKKLFVFVIFLAASICAYPQNISVESIVNECVGYLGKPPPGGFEQITDGLYRKVNNGIVFELILNEGMVAVSTISRTGQGNELSQFYNMFNNYLKAGWGLSKTDEHGSLYYAKNGITAFISKPIDTGFLGVIVAVAFYPTSAP